MIFESSFVLFRELPHSVPQEGLSVRGRCRREAGHQTTGQKLRYSGIETLTNFQIGHVYLQVRYPPTEPKRNFSTTS